MPNRSANRSCRSISRNINSAASCMNSMPSASTSFRAFFLPRAFGILAVLGVFTVSAIACMVHYLNPSQFDVNGLDSGYSGYGKPAGAGVTRLMGTALFLLSLRPARPPLQIASSFYILHSSFCIFFQFSSNSHLTKIRTYG